VGLVLHVEARGGEEQEQQGGSEGEVQGDQEGGAKGCQIGAGWKHFGRLCTGQEEDMPLGQLGGGGQREEPRHHVLGDLHHAGPGQVREEVHHLLLSV